MDRYKEELIKIRSILRDNPRGLTILEISSKLGINRNSIAKYTDVLLTLGHIEMKRIGPAKMYYNSNRIPLSAMLNFSNDSILVFNKEQKVVQVNNSALKLMNVKKEDVIGKSLSNLGFISKVHTMIDNNIQNMKDSDTTIEYNFDNNGEIKYFNMKFIPTTFDTGESGITLIIEDITQHKNSENIIRESEEQFRILFNALKIGVLLIRNDGKLIKINPEAERIFGLKIEDIESNVTKNQYFERIRYDESPMPSEEMAGPRARHEKQRVENVLMGLKKHNGNIIWLNVSAEPIFNLKDEVDKIICFYEDITEKVNCARILTKLKT